jgi:hypothetical protein
MAGENKNTHPLLTKYLEWKELHNDEDYQYDEIHTFINECSRGELIGFMEWVLESNLSK